QVTDPLEAEHRIVNEKRNGRDTDVGVSGSSGGERSHRASLGNAFFENLAVLRFFVVHQYVAIDGLIKLAPARVDSAFAEHRFHAERARFVGDNRHYVLADVRLL